MGPYGRRRQPADEHSRRAPGPGYPPNSGLSSKLQLAATLLSAGLGTRIVTIDWGSFDTHGDQLAGQDPQLTDASRALAAFKADLTTRGVEQNVITLVFSEFGRRLEESDSAGTDHGSGGPIMISGSSVKGGLAGEHPGVNVNQDGDLVVKTDFRTVYQSLIAEWLGGDPNAILPGWPVPGHPALRRWTLADQGRVGTRMVRRPTFLALLVLALAAAPGVAGSAGQRVHRLHVPPPSWPPCRSRSRWTSSSGACGARICRWPRARSGSTSTTAAWTITTSQSSTPTASCTRVPLASGADAVLNVDVAAGPVKLFCSLFAGTPDSHEAKGMLFNLTAR